MQGFVAFANYSYAFAHAFTHMHFVYFVNESFCKQSYE